MSALPISRKRFATSRRRTAGSVIAVSIVASSACSLRAPLPPQASVFPVDEARAAFDSKPSGDGARVVVPSWASLQEVWGTYDPPFVDAVWGPGRIVFGSDDRLLFLLGRKGEIRIWDRQRHATVARLDACVRGEQSLGGVTREESAVVLEPSNDGLAAVGFSSGRFCVLDTRSGEKLTDILAHDLGAPASNVVVARLVAGRLVTYGYRPPFWLPLGNGDTASAPAVGGELRAWDARTGRKLSDATVGGFTSAAISPSGTWFAGGARETRLFDAGGRLVWKRDGELTELTFASDERLLAFRGVELVDVATKDGSTVAFPEAYSAPSTAVPRRAVVRTADGRHALTMLEDDRTVLWDVWAHREVAHTLARFERLDHWASSPSGALFVTPKGSLVGTRTLGVVEQPKGPIRCFAASADAERVVACRGSSPRTFEFWDHHRRTLDRWPRQDAAFVELSPDGSRVLVRTSNANELRDLANGRTLFRAASYTWTPATFSPDGGTFATLTWDEARKAFDATLRDAFDGNLLWRNAEEKPSEHVLAFDAKGEALVVLGWDRRISFLRVRDGSLVRRTRPIAELKQLHVGDGMALVEDAEGLAAVDLDTWRPKWRVRHSVQSGFAVPPNGEIFFEFEDRTIVRRSMRTGDAVGEPIDLDPSDDRPVDLACSADGSVLIVGTERGALLRFRVSEGGDEPGDSRSTTSSGQATRARARSAKGL